jgi:hypothetical protein
MSDVSFTLNVPASGAGTSEDVSTAGAKEKTFTWSGASVDSILAVETSADEVTWGRLVRLEGASGTVTMDLVADFVRLVRWRGTGGAVNLDGQTLPVGATGPTGPTGATGAAGATGATGATGAAGSNGTNGTDGNSFRSGSGAPSSGLGINGDFYLNTSNGDLYSKSAGTWSLGGNIIGAAGATGPAGPTVLEFVQPADVSGTLGMAEKAIGRPGSTVTLGHFRVIPNGDVSGSGMNYASIILSKRSSAGTQTVLATITTVAGWSAWTEVVQAFTGTSILSTDVLTIEITKSGGGVLLPTFLVVIDS